MKCPLLYGFWIARQREELPELSDCLKEECAWWLEDVNMCSIRELALELRYTQMRLQEITFKMPHEEQFRK